MTDRLRLAICGTLLLVCLRAGAQGNPTVNAITQTRDGYLWIGTREGLERYNAWEFTRLPQIGNVSVNALTEKSDGTLWIGTEGSGLYSLQNGAVAHFENAGKTIQAIGKDPSGTIWFASERGVTRLVGNDPRAFITADGAPQSVVRAICAAGDDVWFATDEGLFRYTDGAFTKMSSTSSTSLALDRDGRLWIGRDHGGVDVYANGTFTKPQAAASLALTTVVALAADRDGKIWISAEGRGLCRLSGDRLDCDPTDDTVRSMYEDREGNLWIGTTNSGLHRLSEGMFAIPIAERGPRVVLHDRDGGVWAGTPAGLTHNGVTWTVRDGLATTFVHALAQDRDGAIWIGTSGGLSRWANGKMTTIASDGQADVRALHVDSAGRLWIGTLTGLRCVTDGRLTRCGEGRMRTVSIFAFYEAADGTTQIAPPMDSPVFGILRDDAGNLWLSSAKGIYRGTSLIAPIPSDGDVQPAAWRSADGQLWFVTARGLLSIDPKRVGANKIPPPVIVEHVAVRGRDVEFRYAALSFVEPEEVRYRTMLEGFDRGWMDAGTQRAARYDDLPAGRYTFRVIAANNDGVWNTTGAAVRLRIEQRFWETWWFRVVSLAGIAVILVIAYRIRRANTILEELATIDPLTRLANRRSLDAALGRMWSDHASRGESIAVILCDIDHFKNYNDTYGHQAGDQALVQVAQAIRSAIDPSTDVAARFGGEEFLVVLPHSTMNDAAHIAAKILDAVRALRIEHRASSVAPIVTLSAGVAAAVPEESRNTHDLIREADEALYSAKAAGRNRFTVANSVRSASAR